MASKCEEIFKEVLSDLETLLKVLKPRSTFPSTNATKVLKSNPNLPFYRRKKGSQRYASSSKDSQTSSNPTIALTQPKFSNLTETYPSTDARKVLSDSRALPRILKPRQTYPSTDASPEN